MVLQAFLRRWWLLVLLPAIGIMVAGLGSVMTRSQYQSVVTLQLNPVGKSSFLPYSPQAAERDALVASYREVLRSRAFAETVVQRLNLPMTPDLLGQSITTSPVPNTNILRLIVTTAHPEDAQRLAQAIAEFFVSDAVPSQGSSFGAQSRLAEMEQEARSYPARMDALRQQRDRLDQAAARGDTSRLTELNNLDTRLTGMESSYANLLVEINRTRSSMNTASILDNATPGVATGAMPLSRALPFGLVIGIGLAIGLTLLLERFDDTLRGAADVTALTGQPPIASVGRVRFGRHQSPGQRVLLQASPPPGDRQASALEAFCMLRANVRLAAGDRACRTIVVTSPCTGEGKTFVACNLAVAYARAGGQVLLVDADLRAPSIHNVFGVSNASGYLEAVTAVAPTRSTWHRVSNGQPPLQSMFASATATAVEEERALPGIVPSGIQNLSLLVAGPAPSDPAAVLGSPASARLVEELSERWDVVIFDTTPVLPVADTRTLALGADIALVVARAGVSSRAALSETMGILRQPGRPRLAVVLNGFEPGRLLSRGSGRSLSRA
jgi:Mrp family chromosome partitioning ATPase/capsular polysaccharide biosynthesis protein